MGSAAPESCSFPSSFGGTSFPQPHLYSPVTSQTSRGQQNWCPFSLSGPGHNKVGKNKNRAEGFIPGYPRGRSCCLPALFPSILPAIDLRPIQSLCCQNSLAATILAIKGEQFSHKRLPIPVRVLTPSCCHFLSPSREKLPKGHFVVSSLLSSPLPLEVTFVSKRVYLLGPLDIPANEVVGWSL